MSRQENNIILAAIKDVHLRTVKALRAKLLAGQELTPEEHRALAQSSKVLLDTIRVDLQLAESAQSSYELSDLGLTNNDIQTLLEIAATLES